MSEAAKGIGGKDAGGAPFKPKFTPKAPVKREPVEAPKPVVKEEAPKQRKPRDGGRGSRDQDRRNDTRGQQPFNKGGRGGFQMPTGNAFFSGNATKVLAAAVASASAYSAVSTSHAIKSIKSADASGGHRIARPNEVIDESIAGDGGAAVISEDLSPGAVMDEDDSDASMDEDGERSDHRHLSTVDGSVSEIWPPVKYDPAAPLSLPFGPKTTAMRRVLAHQPILANPSDERAMLDEESSSLFLIQLPSDLTLNGPSGLSVDDTRKVGKLQLFKSGKVKLVTENGKSYDVSTGVSSCFMQCLATVDLKTTDDADGSKSEHNPSSSSRAKSTGNRDSSSSTAAAAASLAPQGTLNLLGKITKKLVVTPDYYDLGQRSSKSTVKRVNNTAEEEVIEDEGLEMQTDELVDDVDAEVDDY